MRDAPALCEVFEKLTCSARPLQLAGLCLIGRLVFARDNSGHVDLCTTQFFDFRRHVGNEISDFRTGRFADVIHQRFARIKGEAVSIHISKSR